MGGDVGQQQRQPIKVLTSKGLGTVEKKKPSGGEKKRNVGKIWTPEGKRKFSS